jgi:hypothetical protein
MIKTITNVTNNNESHEYQLSDLALFVTFVMISVIR